MIKKKSNTQNIIIVILCILLLISIAFGATYSYYNGRSNLIKGSITTANLAIELQDSQWTKAEFFLSTDVSEKHFIPGNSLENVELNIFNKCSIKTYMVILYSLTAVKNPEKGEGKGEVIDVSTTPAVRFNLEKVNTTSWKYIDYECQNITATYTCLVGINEFEGRQVNQEGQKIDVIKANAITIPAKEWGNDLQNCKVTISVQAYAIQSENLEAKYLAPITQAEEDGNITAKANAIARAVLEICKVDY